MFDLLQSHEDKKYYAKEVLKVGIVQTKARKIKNILDKHMMYLNLVHLSTGMACKGGSKSENEFGINEKGSEIITLFVKIRSNFKRPNLLPLFFDLKNLSDYFYIHDTGDYDNPTLAFIFFKKVKKPKKPKRR
jgi:hypothetical protein